MTSTSGNDKKQPSNPFFNGASPLFEMSRDDQKASERIAKIIQVLASGLEQQVKFQVFIEGKAPQDVKLTGKAFIDNPERLLIEAFRYDLNNGELGELWKNVGKGDGKKKGGDTGGGGGIKPYNPEDMR